MKPGSWKWLVIGYAIGSVRRTLCLTLIVLALGATSWGGVYLVLTR